MTTRTRLRLGAVYAMERCRQRWNFECDLDGCSGGSGTLLDHEVNHRDCFFDHVAQPHALERLLEAPVTDALEPCPSGRPVLHQRAKPFDSLAQVCVLT